MEPKKQVGTREVKDLVKICLEREKECVCVGGVVREREAKMEGKEDGKGSHSELSLLSCPLRSNFIFGRSN